MKIRETLTRRTINLSASALSTDGILGKAIKKRVSIVIAENFPLFIFSTRRHLEKVNSEVSGKN